MTLIDRIRFGLWRALVTGKEWASYDPDHDRPTIDEQLEEMQREDAECVLKEIFEDEQ